MSIIRITTRGSADTIEIPRPLTHAYPLAWIQILDEIGIEKGIIAKISLDFCSDFEAEKEITVLRLRIANKKNEVLADVEIPVSDLDEENQAKYDKWIEKLSSYQDDES